MKREPRGRQGIGWRQRRRLDNSTDERSEKRVMSGLKKQERSIRGN